MARLRVRRDVIERAVDSHRPIYESLEIDTTPRGGDLLGEEVTGYVDGQQMLVGPLRRMLEALELTIEDLEEQAH